MIRLPAYRNFTYFLYAGSFVMNILKDWDDHDLPEANFVSISQLKCKRFPIKCNHRILPENFKYGKYRY